MNEKLDRAIGALVGLAVGDAVGTTLEFKERGEFEPIDDMNGGGVFRLKPGEWTDDTSMALCLADSILETGHVELIPVNLMEHFVRWYLYAHNSSNGRVFDIGTTIRRALDKYVMNGYSHAPNDFHSAGNGSIMRLAPVPIRWYNDLDIAVEMAIRQSRATHGSNLCLEACESLTTILVGAINGEAKDVLINPLNTNCQKTMQVPNTGYVLDTMMCAQWAVMQTNTFEDAVLLAANQGGDADTNAAIAGQIAGALYGYSSIRKDWLDKLVQHQHIVDVATQLFEMAI